MKSVQINTNDKKGGAGKIGYQVHIGLKNRGYKSQIISGYQMDSSTGIRIPDNRDSVARLYAKNAGLLYYDMKASHELLFQQEVKDADILHLHNLHGDFFNPFTIPLLSNFKPTLYTLHDMQPLTGHCAHSLHCDKWITGCGNCPDLKIYPALEIDSTERLWRHKKLIYDYSHLSVVVPSDWLKKKVEKSILGNQDLELIYNGTDTDVFTPQKKLINRVTYNIPENVILIGGSADAGVLANPWKGGQYTLEVIDALTKKYPNVIFMNIGTSAPSEHPNIVNVPPMYTDEELSAVYSMLDIFLVTSIAENCPLVVLEALASGVPVVSFATGGIPELIEHNKTGYVADYLNTAQMVEYCSRLIENAELRLFMSAAARERAENLYSLDLMVTKYQRNYERTIEKFASRKNNAYEFGQVAPLIVKTDLFERAVLAAAGNSVIELVGVDNKLDVETKGVLVTSFGARKLDKQLAAVNNWRNLGFKVVSVNNKRDLAFLEAMFPSVEFVGVETLRPVPGEEISVTIADLVKYAKSAKYPLMGIINNDVIISGGDDFIETVKNNCADSVLFGNNCVIHPGEKRGDINYKTVEAVFFGLSAADYLSDELFTIGDSFWGYRLLYKAMKNRVKVRKLIPYLALYDTRGVQPEEIKNEHIAKFAMTIIEDEKLPEAPKTPGTKYSDYYTSVTESMVNSLNMVAEKMLYFKIMPEPDASFYKYYNLNSFIDLSPYDKLIRVTEYLNIKRADRDGWIMRALLLRDLKNYDSCLVSFEKALQLGESEELYNEVLKICLQAGKTKEYEQVKKYLKEKHPDWVNSGLINV